MRKVYFKIEPFQSDALFKHIRSKYDLIRVLMLTIKYIKVNGDSSEAEAKAHGSYFVVCTDKMKRIFYISEKKIFSVKFPFEIYIEDQILKVKFSNKIELDGLLTSQIIAIIKRVEVEFIELPSDLESIFEEENGNSYVLWEVLNGLLLKEYGYVRYEHDPEKAELDLHPLNHLDVCFSNDVKYKIGSENTISPEVFLDILNIKTNCHFIFSK